MTSLQVWGYTVSVLGREEGYMVKYGLSPMDCLRAIPRAQALFYRISRLEAQYGHYPIPNNDLLSFLGLFMIKQLKDQCNTHISVINESESPLGHL